MQAQRAGLSVVRRVDVDDVDVRGEIELFAAQLAHGDDRKPGRGVVAHGGAEARAQLRPRRNAPPPPGKRPPGPKDRARLPGVLPGFRSRARPGATSRPGGSAAAGAASRPARGQPATRGLDLGQVSSRGLSRSRKGSASSAASDSGSASSGSGQVAATRQQRRQQGQARFVLRQRGSGLEQSFQARPRALRVGTRGQQVIQNGRRRVADRD